MLQDWTVEEWRALKEKGTVTTIDVRSPSEFQAATIPGSLNIPLFDDAERAEIGTIYKQTSVAAAKERGLEIVSAKLPAFIKTFAQVPGPKMVFCWRGGMRSKTSATVLSLMGIKAARLTGGYRAYRQWVVEQLGNVEYRPRAYVLHGNTGCGKTAILQRLHAEGHAVLDLEAMAGHRGSIFGGIGLPAHNQKLFDSLLIEQVLAQQDKPFVTIEAESRRIGKVVLPEFVMKKKEEGVSILIELPLAERIRQILNDYRPWLDAQACLEAYRRIRSRIHTPIASEIQSCLEQERYEPAIEMLLTYYYDPKYEFATSRYNAGPDYTVRANTVDEAYAEVVRILQRGGSE